MKASLIMLSLATTALAGVCCNSGQQYCGWELNKMTNLPSTIALSA